MFTRYASFESAQVLDVKGTRERQKTASLDKFSDYSDFRTEDGYMYARIRAISSRVNRNHDGWPSVELAGSPEVFEKHTSNEGFTVEASKERKHGFSTFVGKPIFVDHNNSDPKRARGIIVDAKFHVEDAKTASLDPYYASNDADPDHLPGSWVELLLEVDSDRFPRLAKAIIEGSKDSGTGIDGFSMGCDVSHTICNICSNKATEPAEFCDHVRMKGATFDYHDPKTGKRTAKKSYENCYGIKFFEISAVFDPADETALLRELIHKEAANPTPQSENTTAPEEIDTLRQEKVCSICGSDMDSEKCSICFTPDTLVRTKDDGYVPISTIIPGDYVLSGNGKFNRVLEVMESTHHGLLNQINAGSMVNPVQVTGNHPFQTIIGNHISKKEPCRPSRCNRTINHPNSKTDHSFGWIKAQDLTKANYLVTNTAQEDFDLDSVNVPEKLLSPRQGWKKGITEFALDADFLWIIGYYLAEGSTGTRKLNFASHRDEVEYQQRVIDFFTKIGVTAKLILRDSKPNSAWVDVYSSTLASWFSTWLGDGCANKRIPSEIFNLPLSKLEHVWRGVLDGDGTNGREQLGQTSPILALQMGDIAMRRGGTPSVQVEHPIGKKTVYKINGTTVATLPKPKTRTKRHTWIFANRYLTRITEAIEVPYCGPVFNLRVENDPTYTVENVVVHNCGYVEPPDGLGIPDLEKHQELQEESELMDGGPEEASLPEEVQEMPDASNTAPSGGLTSRMHWTPKVHPKIAARINDVERPIQPGAKPATDEPEEKVIKDESTPVTSSTAADLIKAAGQNTKQENSMANTRVAAEPADPSGKPDKQVAVDAVGGIMDANPGSASAADKRVDVEGKGGVMDADNASASKPDETQSIEETSDNGGFDEGGNKNNNSGPTKTWPNTNSAPAVTNQAFPTSANQGVKPTGGPDVQPQRREDVESDAGWNNSGTGTDQWTGTNGNGVTRQQAPVTNKPTQSGGITSHIVNVMKLADAEIDLGIISKEAKYARIAELESEDEKTIEARLDTYSRVRTAGLKRQASVTRMPSFRNASVETETVKTAGTDLDDPRYDSALFGV